MSIPLRIVERPDTGAGRTLRHAYPEYGWTVQPGDMWREPDCDNADREAWSVVLPNLSVWCTTDRAGESGRWDVTGTPPAITVSPSINDQGQHPWHGHITSGELT